MAPSESSAYFNDAIDDAGRAEAALEASIASLDHVAALGAMAHLRRALASATGHAAHLDDADAEARLAATVARAETLIERGPKPSAGAQQAARAGEWAAWDRERAAWQHELASGGAAVDPALRQAVEAEVGAPLDDARVHTGPGAQAIAHAHGTRALAYGSSIMLGPGESAGDRDLVGHELAHVAQQRGAPPRMQLKGGKHGAEEAKADAVGAKVDASAERLLALKLVTSRWKLVGGELFTPGDNPVLIPKLEDFADAAYGLVGQSQADVVPLFSALTGTVREPYAKALEEVVRALSADHPRMKQIADDVKDILAGGQVQYNATSIMAQQALLSPYGKRALVKSAPAGDLEKYVAGGCRAHGELEAKDRVMQFVQPGITIADPAAVKAGGETRVQGCASTLRVLRGGVPTAATTAAATDATVIEDPALTAAVTKLTAVIDGVLKHHAGKGAPLSPADLAVIQGAVDTAGPAARDRVWADKVTVPKLVAAISPTQAAGIIDSLDPVERLYQTCKGTAATDETDEQRRKQKATLHLGNEQFRDEQIRETQVLGSGGATYTALRTWLLARKDDKAMRMRVLAHTKLKDDCIARLAPDDQRSIYKLVVRGTDASSPEDLVVEGAEKQRPLDVVTGLRQLASTNAPRLAELERDMVFRAAIEKMTAEVNVDGQMVRPYQLAMQLWGHKIGAVVDPTAQVQGEVNAPGADDRPLTIEERITLNRELFDACLIELHDEISGKNFKGDDRERAMAVAMKKLGNPQVVMDTLVKYDRLAATKYVQLLRREKVVFGAELEARYTQRFQAGLRTWIYEHSGPNNRSGSNRVLGTEQGAGVGMFNGQILAAGEVSQAGKMTLQQALRETTSGGEPLSEVASVQARVLARAVNGSDASGVLTSWNVFSGAVLGCKAEIEKLTGIAIRAIDLIRNAYREQSGHLETKLAEKFDATDLATIRKAMGLVPGLDDPPGAAPPSISERGETIYGEQAKVVWASINSITKKSATPDYYALRAIMEMGRAMPPIADLPNQAPESRTLAIAAGHDVEERPPRSFAAYYRVHYGATPELHIAAVYRSFGDDAEVKPDMAAAILFSDASKAKLLSDQPGEGSEKVEIGAYNRALVRANFTEASAMARAEQIWSILHTGGQLPMIEDLLTQHNDEEKRLIRVAFRKISGGLDLTFYIRQAMEIRRHLAGQTDDKLEQLAAATDMRGIAARANTQRSAIGADGSEDLGSAFGVITTTGSESELDRALAISMNGDLDPRTLVRNAVKRGEDSQVVRIVDELKPAQRKSILADGPLIASMQSLLSQQNYERVFKVLTGQADLVDRMLSRTIGNTWWKRHISGRSDQEGMQEDLVRYVDNLRLGFDHELRPALAKQGAKAEDIDNAVNVKTREACADIMSDANVKDIIDRHLGATDAAKARSTLLNGGTENDYQLVGKGSAAEIIAEIRGLALEDRKKKLEDPNYLRMLGQRLTDEKDYRDAMNALTAVGEGTGLAKLDEKSRTEKQTWDAKTDHRETMRALAALSEAELQRLRSDPQAQLQVMNALETDTERTLARQLLFDATAVPKDKDEAARERTVQQCVFRLRVACQTSNKWSAVIEESIHVYKADLEVPASEQDGKKTPAINLRPRVWKEVVGDVRAFAKDHDEHAGAVTTEQIEGAKMIGIVERAVMGGEDPSNWLISAKIWTAKEQLAQAQADGKDVNNPLVKALASEDRYKEEDLISALENSSDEHVAKNWTSIAADPVGGGTTLKSLYARYKTSFELAKPHLLERDRPVGATLDETAPGQAAEPTARPLGDSDPAIADSDFKRQEFLLFVIQVSKSLETMLRPFMGDRDKRGETKERNPDEIKLAGTGNKRFDNLAEVIYARIPKLKPAAVAKAIEMSPEDLWLLTDGTRRQVDLHNLTREKYLRARGLQTSERSVASAEKEDSDTANLRYNQSFSQSTSDGHVDREEGIELDSRRKEADRARDAHKAALEQAAMWASLIVGTLVTIAATILTGGLALGPVGAMAIGAATAALSAKAKSMVNKAILDNEWDDKDESDLIAKEVITSLVTIGTTFYAQKLLAGLGALGTAAKQANAAKAVFSQQPTIWRTFLNQASEQVVSTSMTTVVEAGLEATDPMHYVDGYREGSRQAKEAGYARISQIGGDIKNGVITSLLTASLGKIIGRKNGGHVEYDAAAAGRRQISLTKNIQKVFGDPEQKVTGALVEWAMSQSDPIDWANAPKEILQGTIRQYNQVGTEMVTTTAMTASRGRSARESLAMHGGDMTHAEVSAYKAMNKSAGATDPFVSAKQYADMRTQIAATGLDSWQAGHPDKPLNDAQREAFVKWAREGADGDALAQRATTDPMTVEAVVKAAATPDAAPVATKPPPRGEGLAAQVRGAQYTGDGKFRVETPHGHLDVAIHRVPNGEPRVRRLDNGEMALEIPFGLGDAELDHAIVSQLATLSGEPAHAKKTERMQATADPDEPHARKTQAMEVPEDPAHARKTQTMDVPDVAARPTVEIAAVQVPTHTGARPVHDDLPSIQHLQHLPPEVMIGAHQQSLIEPRLQQLSHEDYVQFRGLEASVTDPVARGFLYKALASKSSMADIAWLADQMVGHDGAWLVDHLTLGDPRGVGGGIKQQWSMSCNASMVITMRGNYDPVFALKLRTNNIAVGDAHESDPHALNMHQADLEKQMFETAYGGGGWGPAEDASHGRDARPRATASGQGRGADDLLNALSDVTGVAFQSRRVTHPGDALPILDQALANHMQVPLVIGNGANHLLAHYVLAQWRYVAPDGSVHYQLHDTADGRTAWVSAEEIRTGKMPMGWEVVSAVEVPRNVTSEAGAPAMPNAAAGTHTQGASHDREALKQGIDSLNTEGSFDYRVKKVRDIRGDIENGTRDHLDGDVSSEVADLMKDHIHNVSDEQLVAIQGYSSEDYEKINKVMRNPDADPALTATLRPYVEAIRSGLAALPSYDGEVYRGTSMSDAMWRKWEEAYANNTPVSDPAFSSSSKNAEIAEDFISKTRGDGKTSVFVTIQSRTGKQIEFLSRSAYEAEVLFSGGAKFKIIHIEDGHGPDGKPRKQVHLREIVEAGGSATRLPGVSHDDDGPATKRPAGEAMDPVGRPGAVNHDHVIQTTVDAMTHDGVEPVVIADVHRLASADPARFAALLGTHGKRVVEYLRYNPARDLDDLTKAIESDAKQVRHHIDDMYPNIPQTTPGDTAPAAGWNVRVKQQGTDWNSTIRDPGGKSLSIGRNWDPSTGTLTMDTAFGSPGMDMVPTSPALIESKGKTPAMAYVNLHQMRAMGIPYGKGIASSPLKKVKMSTIQNFETIGHLEWLRTRFPGASLDELIVHTASYRYAEDIITQAGYKVVGYHVDTSGGSISMQRLLGHYENDRTAQHLFQQSGADRKGVHDKMLGKYDIDADSIRTGASGQSIATNFDIHLYVEPIQ